MSEEKETIVQWIDEAASHIAKMSSICVLSSHEISDIIAKQSPKQEDKWISVRDRLPEARDVVLAFDGEINISMFRPDKNQYRWDCDTYWLHDRDVTHWMPLPEPPK